MNHKTAGGTAARETQAYDPDDAGPTVHQTAAPVALVRRISWGAVFAGAVVALATQLLLGMLGLGIGASTINPTTEQNPANGLGTGAAIWFTISTLLSLFAGGMVAGRLAGMPLRADGMLHGLVVWGTSTLLTFYLLTTAIGGIIGGTASILGKGLSVAGQGAATAATAAGNAASSNPDAVGQAQGKLGQLQTEAQDKIGQLKGQAQANAPEIETKARQAGEATASGVSKAALATFVILLLGAIAAAIGGGRAAPHDLTVARGTARPTA